MLVRLALLCGLAAGATERPPPGPEYDGSGPIAGRTPCCFDRLTDIVCLKLKARDSAQFLHKCLNNPDFALVQCCRTW